MSTEFTEWKEYFIYQVGKVVTGYTPSKHNLDCKGNIPFISPSDINGNKNIKSSARSISELALHKNREIPKNSVLVTCIGSIGKVSITNKRSATNQQINSIICNDGFYHEYIYYSVLNISNYLVKISNITTLPIINKTDFENLKLTLPNFSDQKKISKILSSVDLMIELIEQKIEKLEILKKGIMFDLLTKGIGHTNFKDSPILSIPEEWSIKRLKDISIKLIDGDRGHHYPSQEELKKNGHCLFLNATNVTKSGFNFKNFEYISKVKDSLLSKGKIRLNDIVITTRGTVGNIAFYSNKIGLKNMRINSGMVIIRSDDKELINEFLYHSLQSFYFEFNYKKFASGSAQPQLPIKDLENFMVPIPQMSEQLKIIKIANKISNKILLANVLLDKYQNLKKALMQDLLMGKSGIKF
ncbi:hypothetical protein GCL60_15710 [Silvanigrella paludirubra]|uniref:Type I restriction modification DNA specificity domain-containing protein n=1 Tax=Silvanigrella paludirubra TaxID=2499159 RepID=A0A6N6VU37_9BACT|nr:restriction endonuclease subunit S [Silvanigrella paludirubra]KAB8036232.1 hypothetical protein GCL60_15710 [Silvanigrella paludirubra]